MPALAVTLTLHSSDPNQHIYELKYTSDQTWVKFPSLCFEIRCPQGFRNAQTHSLTHGRTGPNTESLRRHKNVHFLSAQLSVLQPPFHIIFYDFFIFKLSYDPVHIPGRQYFKKKSELRYINSNKMFKKT